MASRGMHLLFLIVLSYARVTHSASCRTEEAKNDPSDTSPDVNITVLPGLVAHVGDELKIICVADKPRYVFKEGVAPRPPNRVAVVFNGGKVYNKNCPRTGGRIECVLTVPLTKTANSVSVICNAANDNGCRTLTLFAKIQERKIKNSSKATSVKVSPSQVVFTSVQIKTTSSFSSSVDNKKKNSSEATSLKVSPSQIVFTSVPMETTSSLSSLVDNTKKNSFEATSVEVSPLQVVFTSVQMETTSSLSSLADNTKKNSSKATSVEVSPSQVVFTSVQMETTSPLSSLVDNTKGTASIELTPNSASKITSSHTAITPGGSGGNSEGSKEDEEELDDVKKLITATLILVIVMLLLMTVAFIYVLRLKN